MASVPSSMPMRVSKKRMVMVVNEIEQHCRLDDVHVSF